MAMAGKCYAFAFLTLCSLLCVSALGEGGNPVEREEVNVIGVDQILRLPSEKESRGQAIPWEQSPLEIHSFRVSRRPMLGEDEREHRPGFEEGRFSPLRFRFGRPGGCHGKFRHFLMPREDPFHPLFSRRMGRHRHAHAQPFWFPAMEDLRRDDGRASSIAFHAHPNREGEGMGFEKQFGHRDSESERGVEERKEEKPEREALWTAWLRSFFN